jgi:hypothetical protein
MRLFRSSSDGGVASTAMAMAPTPIVTVAPTSRARGMNPAAEKARSMTRVIPPVRQAMSARAWPLRWNSGKAVKTTSSGTSSLAPHQASPMCTK